MIIAVYLVGTIFVGILFRGRQSDAEDYFTASGRMGSSFNSLLVGLSLAATLFSGISFIMISALIVGTFAGAVVAWSPWYALWVAPVSFSATILWGIGGSCVLGHEDEPS